MNQFVESLKRLYESKKISEEKIIDMCKKNTISIDEKQYILNKN